MKINNLLEKQKKIYSSHYFDTLKGIVACRIVPWHVIEVIPFAIFYNLLENI